MVLAKKYVYVLDKKYDDFYNVKPGEYKVFEEELRPLKDKEFLVKAEYISVDPYNRVLTSLRQSPDGQFGFQVGEVVESRNEKFPVNAKVVSHAGWRDYTILDEREGIKLPVAPYIAPHIGKHPLSTTIGAVGMTGLTAYYAVEEYIKPKPGGVYVVTTAAGAVGSIAGQIIKINGGTTIGFTSTDEKVKVLTEQLAYDYAFNYKTVDIDEVLNKVAPKGINGFVDNVSGELGEKISKHVVEYGSIVISGATSIYSDLQISEVDLAKIKFPDVSKTIALNTFLVTQFGRSRDKVTLKQLADWVKSGKIVSKETITYGFDNILEALEGMLNGRSIGKAIVKI